MSEDDSSTSVPTPIVVKLAAGTYFWCACGESQHQPFCDGSHRTANANANLDASEPLKWKLDEDKRVALCTCKRTATPPLCDGSHG